MYVDKTDLSHIVGAFNVSTWRAAMDPKWYTTIRRMGTEILVHERQSGSAIGAFYAHQHALGTANVLDEDFVGKAGLYAMDRRATETGDFVKIPVYIMNAGNGSLYIQPVGGQGKFWVDEYSVDLKEFNHERE